MQVNRLEESDKDANCKSSTSFNGNYNGLSERVQLEKIMERKNRESIVLWKKPLTTLHYFCLELMIIVQEYWKR